MAFNIMDMFGPVAMNRLLQPLQNAQGIPNMLMQPQAAPPLPAPVNVGPSPGMNMPQPDPMQTAAIQPGAAQAPARQSPFSGINKELLNDVFMGWAMGNTPQQSLTLGAVQASKGKSSRQNLNQTVEWLKGRGMDEGQARMVASSPETLQDYLKTMMNPSDGRKSLVSAGGSLYNTETGEWITPPAGASRQTEYGLNLVYGRDTSGKTVAFQLSKDGTYKPFEPPGGVELTPGVSQVDTGTGTVLLNNKTGEQVGEIAKDVSGVAREKASGTAVGEAQAALPSAEMTANLVSQQIQELKGDPYLDKMVGSIDARLPNISSDAARVQGRMDQLQGGAFLQARQMLKGGGAITDYEGAKAENAYARLQAAQSEQDYRQALDDFNEAVQIGLRKLQRQAGGGVAQPQPSAPAMPSGGVRRYNPATGMIE